MKKVWVFGCFMALVVVTVLFAGCSKNEFTFYPDKSNDTATAKQNVSLYLSEGAAYYDSVVVNIKSVSILVDTCDKGTLLGGYYTSADSICSVWIPLKVNAGQYNLLAYKNGLDTLLASGSSIPAGKIKMIKINIGPNNYFIKDSVTYPLRLFNGDSAIGLINLRGNEFDTYAANSLRLWIDFNISRSIVTSNNVFYLSPVVGYFILNTTGSISGTVLPRNALPILSIYNGTDTAYAFPNSNGYFSVNGLNSGSYSLFVNATNGYKDTTINNIVVRASNTTSVGTITLHQ